MTLVGEHKLLAYDIPSAPSRVSDDTVATGKAPQSLCA